MDPFGLVPNIIATIGATYKVIKFFEEIKSSGLDCNKYISEASSSYIILQQVRERLPSNGADGQNVQPWFRYLQALAGEDGVLQHYKSDMDQVANILIQVKNYRFRRVFVWHREKQKLEDILKKVERHKSTIQLALSHDQLSLSSQTQDAVNRVEARIETNAGLHATEKARLEREEMIEWIYKSTVNHDNFQRDYSAAVQDGTGQAFLDSDTFRGWLEGTCATVFCPGLPGAGKTAMASIVKSHLDNKTIDSNTLTAVLYFNYKRHLEDHGHRTLLVAVLAQFLSQTETIPDRLQKMFKRDPRGPFDMGVDSVISILEDLVQSSRMSFLVMDALDEFYDDDGGRSRFLSIIQRLQASSNLRIMMTARPHLNNDPAISKWSDATIQITASDDDLHTYLDHKICGFPYLPDDFDLRSSIADRIVEASAGVFLLAVLHSDSLKDAYNAYEVEDVLNNLSKGPDALDRAYEDAIKRIDHQPANRQHYARLTISWMVQCLQPMTPSELQHAVTKPEHLERGLSPSGLIKIDALVSFCAGLVTIDHESNVVRFVHYTTQEYFTRARLIKWLPGAELDPARVCTTYMMDSKLLQAIERAHESWSERTKRHEELLMSLNWDCDKPPSLDELDMCLQDTLARWPFLAYSRKHWRSHCSEVQKPLQALLLNFLTGPAKVVYREPNIQRYELYYDCGPPVGWIDAGERDGLAHLRQVTPISICSGGGLNHLVKELLDKGSELRVAPMLTERVDDASGFCYGYLLKSPPFDRIAHDEPFLLAYQTGNMELAALLLERTSIPEDVHFEVFRAADETGNLDLLELMVKRCPLEVIALNRIAVYSSIDEPQIKNSLLDRELYTSHDESLDGLQHLFRRPTASFWVDYLLEQGVSINTIYPEHDTLKFQHVPERTGIELSAASNCLDTVQILLNHPDVRVGHALTLAVEEGNLEIVQILLNRPGVQVGHALTLAVEKRNLKICRTLLSHVSRSPDAADMVQHSIDRVFQLLADYREFPHVECLKSLLEHEDLSRLPFERLEKALKSVVSSVEYCEDLDAQTAILDLILHQSNIDFRRTGIHGRSLLQTALPCALTQTINFYHSKFSDYEEERQGTGCRFRCVRIENETTSDDRHTRAVNMLLRHPSFDYTGQYNPISELLTQHQYFASHVGEQGDSSLDVTEKLEMILKDPRFHPDTSDELGRTALSYACEYHCEYFVRMLVQHPLVDVNSQDVFGRTPLSYAAGGEYGGHATGDRSVLPIMVANEKARANANCPDTSGITPLMYSCRVGRPEEVGLLLNIAGSEANLHDERGRTPLFHALESYNCEHEPLGVLLANPNIRVNANDKDGRSTLFYALRYQCVWPHTTARDIPLLLQHEDLDISEALLEMRDDDGQVLRCDEILRFWKAFREPGRALEDSYHKWTPLSPTALRNLDFLESILSMGDDQSDTFTTTADLVEAAPV